MKNKNEAHHGLEFSLFPKMMKMISRITCIILMLSLYFAVSAQDILKHIEIESSDRGVERIEFDKIHRMDNGEYYILITDDLEDEITIGDTTIESPYVPDTLDLITSPKQVILAKFNAEFELLDYVQFAKIYPFNSLAVSEDRIFMSYNQFFTPHFMLNDSLILTTGHVGGIMEFDFDLNFLGRKQMREQLYGNIVASDTILYLYCELSEDLPYLDIEEDTLWNYIWSIDDDEISYGEFTPAIMRYDYRRDKVESYWKVGGKSSDFLSDMTLDADENLTIVGYTDSGPLFSFEDDIPEGGPNKLQEPFVGKYDKYGNFLGGILTPDIPGDIYSQVLTDDTSIYLRGKFLQDTLIIGSDTLINVIDETGERGSGRGYIAKFDEDFNFVWVYTLRTLANFSHTTEMTLFEGEVFISYTCGEAQVVVQGIDYHFSEGATLVISLDKNTGDETGHFIVHEYFSSIDHISPLADNKIDMFLRPKGEMDIFGTLLGDDTKAIYSLMQVDLDALSSIQDISSDDDIHIYPMPTRDVSELFIESPNMKLKYYSIYNSMGHLIAEGSFDSNDYNLSNVSAITPMGIYYLVLENDKQSSMHAISVVR